MPVKHFNIENRKGERISETKRTERNEQNIEILASMLNEDLLTS